MRGAKHRVLLKSKVVSAQNVPSQANTDLRKLTTAISVLRNDY